ncbi:MAG: hypothetical protein LBC34_02915 [Rickettsiales bacterium]|jgi:uncharacterized RDD family membrane protein YckC|nr:hypothetical protein [Rickettsiales bacterium]
MNIHTISLDGSKIDLSLAFDRSISQFFLHLLNDIIAILIELFQEQNVLVSTLGVLGAIILLLTFSWYSDACFSEKKQTYHDMIFGTIVVKGAIK